MTFMFALYFTQNANAFSGGSGTSGDPYKIATVADLVELNSYSGTTHSGKYFELTANIDLNVAPYNTGAGWTPLTAFYGNFDGNGHTISNLYINTTGTNKGLFASLAGATEFKDVNITGASIVSNNQNIGVLAGTISSRTISNVAVSGTVTVSGSNGLIGGLTGSMSSTTAVNVSSAVNVTASSAFTAVGGLAGGMTSSTINSGSSTGTVVGGSYRVGGLVGNTDSNSAIRRSFSTGSVTSTSGETGGLVGALYGDLEDSYSRSSVTTANLSKGGLVGFANESGARIVRSYATGLMSAGTGAGLLGNLYAGSCNSSFWDATTTGRSTSACSGAGATSKTTAQMKDVATFTNTSTSTGLTTAWDFTGNPNNDSGNANYWNIDTNGVINDGYPYLNGYVANSTPTVGSLGSSGYVNGSWGTDTTPTLEFTTADADGSDTVQYQIQIDDTSSFASPVVDYTSALSTPGATTFTIGQAAGTGVYTTGASGQTLANAQYYWRVKAIDNLAADSGYTAANSGSVAFGVDTTAPSTPGTPSGTSPTNDTTPTITWAASTDTGVGMHSSIPYDVQWSPSSDFTGVGTTTTSVNTTSYTLSSGLSEGTWYFRIRAWDNLENGPALSATATMVIDTTAPTANTVSPSNGQGDIGLADNLILNMSENVSKGTGNILIKRVNDDTTIQTIDVAGGAVTASGSTVSINPGNFPENTSYYVTIPNTAFVDGAGNAFAGISNATTWTFTTVDLQDPILSAPTTGTVTSSLAFDITVNETPLSGSLQLIFSGSASRTITLNDLGTGNHSFTINPASPSSASQVASIAGGSTIPNGTYNITLQHQDSSGVVTLSDSNTNITIDATAPTITNKTPSLSATGVALNANLVMVFDEEVQLASGEIRIRRWQDGAVVEAIDVAGSQISGSGTDTLTIDPAADFDNAVLYYIEVTDTAVRDLAGNNFAGITNSAAWKFSTIGVASNGKVSASPLTASITEGDSKLFGLLLDEPIIGGPDVTVTITSADSTVLSSSSPTVSFPSASWTEARNFILSAADDSLDNGNRTITVSLAVASGSEYYNAYTKTLVITIIDDDSTPGSDSPTVNGGSTAKTSARGGTATNSIIALVDQQRDIDSGNSQTNIYLDGYPEFKTATGKQMNLKIGQVVFFTVNNEEHTATITGLTDQTVTLVLASTPQTVTLMLAEAAQYDVTNDGKKDIEISINSITNEFATITFKSLAEQPVKGNTKSVGRASNTVFWVLLFGACFIALVLLVRRKKRSGRLRVGED